MTIDLRSDTVTKPSEGMLEAMIKAKTGDDVYKEDPTVNLLEERVANMFGMDAGLFFPTGSMANQAAIKLHTQPGEQLICDKWAHVYNYEGGGVSFNSGVSCKLIDGDRGMITAQQVASNINPPDFYHSPLTTLVCLENTTNKGGGACYSLEEIAKVRQVCTENGLALHLDGARLFNAIVAKNTDPKDFGNYFDTISICFSKGLGTPLGTVLIGKKSVMEGAMRIRKTLGGGMRQIGYMAATALYALDNNIDRLKEDHLKAKELANILEDCDFVEKVEPTETNIVIFYLKDEIDKAKFLSDLESNSVRLSDMGEGKLRIVTHLDYTDTMHTRFCTILKEYS